MIKWLNDLRINFANLYEIVLGPEMLIIDATRPLKKDLGYIELAPPKVANEGVVQELLFG